MTLVEHNPTPLDVLRSQSPIHTLIALSSKPSIAGNHNIVFLKLRCGRFLASVIDEDIRLVIPADVSLDLLAPIAHDTDRCNDEGWALAAGEHQADDLESLAETHVVGENTAGE